MWLEFAGDSEEQERMWAYGIEQKAGGKQELAKDRYDALVGKLALLVMERC